MNMTAGAARCHTQSAPPQSDLVNRVEACLHRESLNLQQISLATGASAELVGDVVADAVSRGRVANVGSVDYPIYTLRLEPGSSDAQAMRQVRRLLSERPMSSLEIADAIGVDRERARRLVMSIPRHHMEVIAGRWFLIRGEVRDV